MLAYAVIELGLPEAVFWKLTPAKFFSYAEIHNERVRREDYRTAVLVTRIRQIAGSKNAHLWDDFPSLEHLRRRKAVMSQAERRANFLQLAAENKKKKGS